MVASEGAAVQSRFKLGAEAVEVLLGVCRGLCREEPPPMSLAEAEQALEAFVSSPTSVVQGGCREEDDGLESWRIV